MEKVSEMANNQVNALAVLKRIGECCVKEGTEWQANVKALHKAFLDEQASEKKAREKAEKDVKLAADRERAKAEKELAKQREKAEKAERAKAAKEAALAGAPLADAEKPSKRRRTGANHVSEDDPVVLREMGKFEGAPAMLIVEQLEPFVEAIADSPDRACVCRLKKNAMRRVIMGDPRSGELAGGVELFDSGHQRRWSGFRTAHHPQEHHARLPDFL